jgi:hypothetical protein
VSRDRTARDLVDWVGADALELVDAATGWPAHFLARTISDWVRVATYLGPIGHSHRGRGDIERRFQNPGKNRPLHATPDQISLLIGLYESDGTRLLVGMDVQKRLGKSTRQSLFMPLQLLRSAETFGWSEHFSDTNERIVAFTPRLLPIYVELRSSGIDIAAEKLEQLVFASGAGDVESGADAVRRAMTTVSRLVEDAKFSRAVCDAYDGCCSMCGLGFSLVESAHIYPAGAPGSEREVWNGLALCRNHHAAFESFFVHVDPVSNRVRLHPDLIDMAKKAPGCKAFVEVTFPTLATPRNRDSRPRPEMFEKRYEYFKPKYAWC